MRAAWAAMGLAFWCSVSVAQAPPIKMGLWEGTIVSTSSSGPATTTIRQSCMTPEIWEKEKSAMNMQMPVGCTIKHANTGKGFTFDSSCALPNGMSVAMSGTTTIDDTEHTHAVIHSKTVLGAQGTKESDTTLESHFVSADCGAVLPGKPVITPK